MANYTTVWGGAAVIALAAGTFVISPRAMAQMSPAAPATTGAGAAARPSMTPAPPIAPKPSAPRAGGNAGNLSTALLRAPSAQALQAPAAGGQNQASAAKPVDAIPADSTFTAPGSRLGQF